ncbi:MAG: hypothetical protein H6999_06875 [Hahellaceae bacterium]|nr:hypothetical protein [Hahellaceae bacterium]
MQGTLPANLRGIFATIPETQQAPSITYKNYYILTNQPNNLFNRISMKRAWHKTPYLIKTNKATKTQHDSTMENNAMALFSDFDCISGSGSKNTFVNPSESHSKLTLRTEANSTTRIPRLPELISSSKQGVNNFIFNYQ